MSKARCTKMPSPYGYGSRRYREGRRLLPNLCIAADVVRRRDTNCTDFFSVIETHPREFGQLFSQFRTGGACQSPCPFHNMSQSYCLECHVGPFGQLLKVAGI
ncbi:hypothetical protein CGRA01v4_02883 [Colletotrichum graminicola]|nr:hypothetical protein CGRA01v4_02883 [Colletotrichum graminicola]